MLLWKSPPLPLYFIMSTQLSVSLWKVYDLKFLPFIWLFSILVQTEKERTGFPTACWTISFNSTAASTVLIPVTCSKGLSHNDPHSQDHTGLGFDACFTATSPRVPDILCNLLIIHSWPQASIAGLRFLILPHRSMPRTFFQYGI